MKPSDRRSLAHRGAKSTLHSSWLLRRSNLRGFARAVLLLVAVLSLAPSLALAQKAAPPVVAPATGPSLENYYLMPTDRVTVRVFQEEDLTTEARVSNDGTIGVPLIGSVKVGGLNIQEAAAEIRTRLKKGYLVNPQVTVSITEFSKRRFTVMGQVQKGGTYQFPDQGGLDLLQAIGMAGGYTRVAEPSKVTVQRNQNGKATTFKLNAKAMAEGKDKPFDIQAGDTITVSETWF